MPGRTYIRAMYFREFLSENIYYHGTTARNAEAILRDGIDVSRYRSGMFRGFYLSPSASYLSDDRHEAVLVFDVDASKLMDASAVTDADLEALDPRFKMMSYGYRNSLIEKLAKARGMSGVVNGREVVLFDNRAVRSVKMVRSGQAAS